MKFGVFGFWGYPQNRPFWGSKKRSKNDQKGGPFWEGSRSGKYPEEALNHIKGVKKWVRNWSKRGSKKGPPPKNGRFCTTFSSKREKRVFWVFWFFGVSLFSKVVRNRSAFIFVKTGENRFFPKSAFLTFCGPLVVKLTFWNPWVTKYDLKSIKKGSLFGSLFNRFFVKNPFKCP